LELCGGGQLRRSVRNHLFIIPIIITITLIIPIIITITLIIMKGRFYKYAMKDVLAYQLSTHNDLLLEVQQVEAQVLEMLRTNPFPVPNSNPDVIRILTEFTNNQVRG